jgi:sugar transferase (PEP-CTERM/EpsH1 system associated)
VFESCSAYQPMDLLFLSHCVPNPPDKGEKIRAFHELSRLAACYRVHLACFARSAAEVKHAEALRDRCASVFVEPLRPGPSFYRAGISFMAGRSLSAAFYRSKRMRRHIASLAGRVSATVAYSSVVAPYAPAHVPMLLDMVDVDSEKWLQYGGVRTPGALYAAEGRRLRRLEIDMSRRASRTILSTWNEARLLGEFAPDAAIRCMENGVDFEYFDPSRTAVRAELCGRRFAAFVGAMDYFPNADAACWFASRILPAIRHQVPDFEFLVVGRNPGTAVRRLGQQPGITVTGAVADVRPYVAAAEAVVAPLRIARGIQNKVLEALAMGKQVHVSPAVCATFGAELPAGVIRCDAEQDYAVSILGGASLPSATIRADARRRFSWDANLEQLMKDLEAVCGMSPALATDRYSRAQ